MNRSLRRGLLGGLSFGTALFVFQACYGTPQDMEFDDQIPVYGTIHSSSQGEALDSIRVWDRETLQYGITNHRGEFEFWIPRRDSVWLRIEALEERSGPSFEPRDTLVTEPEGYGIELNLALEEA